ncbi:MAG: type VI secretion protein, partial [Micromonosporaceae bacterium]|nr:type VI secretion protein [Micromonosporaceae bacterium]
MMGDLSPVVSAWPWLAVATALCLAGGVVGRERLLVWRHRRLVDGARWVTIAAPPEVAAESAAALWSTMAGVLTPSAWRRRLFGMPHVAWEYIWTGRTLAVRLWVPGTVPAGAVEAAVRAAWPACTVATDQTAGAPIPSTVAVQAGGALWPQQTDLLPLRTDHEADPLRALFAAGAQVRHREHACVQVLVRPASARRVRRARTTAAKPAGDGVARVVTGLAGRALDPILWL